MQRWKMQSEVTHELEREGSKTIGSYETMRTAPEAMIFLWKNGIVKSFREIFGYEQAPPATLIIKESAKEETAPAEQDAPEQTKQRQARLETMLTRIVQNDSVMRRAEWKNAGLTGKQSAQKIQEALIAAASSGEPLEDGDGRSAVGKGYTYSFWRKDDSRLRDDIGDRLLSVTRVVSNPEWEHRERAITDRTIQEMKYLFDKGLIRFYGNDAKELSADALRKIADQSVLDRVATDPDLAERLLHGEPGALKEATKRILPQFLQNIAAIKRSASNGATGLIPLLTVHESLLPMHKKGGNEHHEHHIDLMLNKERWESHEAGIQFMCLRLLNDMRAKGLISLGNDDDVLNAIRTVSTPILTARVFASPALLEQFRSEKVSDNAMKTAALAILPDVLNALSKQKMEKPWMKAKKPARKPTLATVRWSERKNVREWIKQQGGSIAGLADETEESETADPNAEQSSELPKETPEAMLIRFGKRALSTMEKNGQIRINDKVALREWFERSAPARCRELLEGNVLTPEAALRALVQRCVADLSVSISRNRKGFLGTQVFVVTARNPRAAQSYEYRGDPLAWPAPADTQQVEQGTLITQSPNDPIEEPKPADSNSVHQPPIIEASNGKSPRISLRDLTSSPPPLPPNNESNGEVSSRFTYEPHEPIVINTNGNYPVMSTTGDIPKPDVHLANGHAPDRPESQKKPESPETKANRIARELWESHPRECEAVVGPKVEGREPDKKSVRALLASINAFHDKPNLGLLGQALREEYSRRKKQAPER